MKKVIFTMLAFFMVLVLGGGIISMVLTAIIGGGVSESFIYPLYGGIILLSGLIVGCTCVILNEIKELKAFLENMKNK